MNDQLRREGAIFDEVLSLSPEEQGAYLDRSCGADLALRRSGGVLHSKSSSLAWTRANHFTGSERLHISGFQDQSFSLFLKDPLGSRQFNYDSDEESQFTQSAGARPGGQRFVRFMCLSCSIPAALLAPPCALKAESTAHYPPGLHGINAATLPPPGFYVRDYNFFYLLYS